MREVIAITKALADENRVRTLMFLREGDLCVCQIMEILKLAPSTVSQHLTILHDAGLVESRKEGKWIYYGLPAKPTGTVRDTLKWLAESLKNDEQMKEDAKRLKAVVTMDKGTLCERYKRAAPRQAGARE